MYIDCDIGMQDKRLLILNLDQYGYSATARQCSNDFIYLFVYLLIDVFLLSLIRILFSNGYFCIKILFSLFFICLDFVTF